MGKTKTIINMGKRRLNNSEDRHVTYRQIHAKLFISNTSTETVLDYQELRA